MTGEVTVIIDQIPLRVTEETTILKAAELVGHTIPTICFHDHCTSNAVCRTCVVEVNGSRVLVASCVTRVREGMIIYTRSPRVELARRTIFEMLDSAVDLDGADEILEVINEYQADRQRFPDAEKRINPVLDDNPMFVRDYSKCVLCWRCVQVCADDAQYTYAINFADRGYETRISTYFNKPLPETSCVFCGQCVGVCPTDALLPKKEWLIEQGLPLEMAFTKRRRSS